MRCNGGTLLKKKNIEGLPVLSWRGMVLHNAAVNDRGYSLELFMVFRQGTDREMHSHCWGGVALPTDWDDWK
jgi:hypothetical protein